MQKFLMCRHDWENSHYRTIEWAVPIDCPHCGGGKCGPEPPYHPHRPAVWRCYDCRGQFSNHRVEQQFTEGLQTMTLSIEKKTAGEIGQYGYSHWSGKPVTPEHHEYLLVPQTVADGWDCFCSCGEWRGFETFYEIQTKDELIAALKQAHAEHVNQQPASSSLTQEKS